MDFSGRPILIAGPCAAETREQVLETAKQMSAAVHSLPFDVQAVFRAGIWKPRTSPHSFQGVGEIGLAWLQEVKQSTGMWVATEVATSEQARSALKAGLDAVWIGARTSANPQQVQIIADTLKPDTASLKAVMVKNPMHEDAALWQGNIERMLSVGIPVWAVHRGCNHHPCWQMPYTVHKQMPSIPLIIDPSHMSGNAQLVPPLCHKASVLGYNGWMIEVHPSPADAWSDAGQQIMPGRLAECLKLPQKADDLRWLREQMDEIDDELWLTIAKRMETSSRIGSYKKGIGMTIIQPERFDYILKNRIRWGAEHGISEDTVRRIMTALHQESINRQR